MRIIEDVKLDFSDVLIVPKRSSLTSRKEVNLIKDYNFKYSKFNYSGVPIISSNMSHTGTIKMANALSKFDVSTALHKHYSEKELINYFNKHGHLETFYSMGILDTDYDKFKRVYERVDGKIEKICIDVANGYSEALPIFVAKIRKDFENDLTIMAGSVVTPEMTEHLLLSGADIVRVGIGSGSVCTTRKLTGVGYPQLSAAIECADAAHGLEGHICSDGGCQMPGDLAKAFGAGADFIMLGGMMAGHDECDGEHVHSNKTVVHSELGSYEENNEITHMKFYGMSSADAMEKYSGGIAKYRAAEGKSVLVPYRGKVENTIQEILGGLRSACTYVGAKRLKELSKRTTFIKVHNTHNIVFGDEK